jgi:hypothetical protein
MTDRSTYTTKKYKNESKYPIRRIGTRDARQGKLHTVEHVSTEEELYRITTKLTLTLTYYTLQNMDAATRK